jgi:hypothetical protein
VSGAPISERIAARSIEVVSSTIPADLTLDEWRRTRAAGRLSAARRRRLRVEALHLTSSLKRWVT